MLPRLRSAILTERGRDVLLSALLLALAAGFMVPGLPPWGVAAPMEQLLKFAPWSALYPAADPRLMGSDVLFQQLPWHHWMVSELAAGRFPLWASEPLGGYPLFAYYQTGVLYPLHLLWALLPTGPGFGIILMLKLWIAGLGTYFFLRSLSIRRAVAVIGAVSFMFSAGVVTWLPWSHTNATILLPWLALCVYEWIEKGKRAAVVWFALLLAFALLGGSPEFFFIVAVVAGLWALGLLVRSAGRASLVASLKRAGGLVVAGLVGALISGVQILPFFEALSISHIATIRPVGNERALLHLDAGMMLNWVLPRYWGQVQDGVFGASQIPNETNGYVGSVALVGLALLLAGLLRRDVRLRPVISWAAAGVVCWLAAYDTTVGTLIRSLPGFSQMVNERFIVGVGFALVVLGAFGLDWFAGWAEANRPMDARAVGLSPVTLVGGALVLAGGAFLVAHVTGIVPHPNTGEPPGAPRYARLYLPTFDYRLYWAAWQLAVASVAAGALLLWKGSLRWTALSQSLLVGVLVADLWMLLYTYNPSAPAGLYYPDTRFTSQLSAIPLGERFVAQGDSLITHTGLVYGYPDWRAQEPMFSERALKATTFLDPIYRSTQWTRYNMILSDLRLPVAPVFGIRYFVFPSTLNPNESSPGEVGRPAFRRLAFTEGLGLWEAEGVPGFAYVTTNVAVAPEEPVAAKWVQDSTWERLRLYPAVVEAPAEAIAGIEKSPTGPSGSADLVTYEPGRIVLNVSAERSSLLVVAESLYDGWHASVDGRPAPVLRTNYISQGVVVPQGQSRVELKYEPASLRVGAALSVAGLLGLLALILWSRRQVGRTVEKPPQASERL